MIFFFLKNDRYFWKGMKKKGIFDFVGVFDGKIKVTFEVDARDLDLLLGSAKGKSLSTRK
jgi:hypothetical protein